jgi:alpha-1,4-digalacturonate transport system permease protein
MPDGTVRELAQVRRIGLIAQMVDPKDPLQQFRVAIDKREPVRKVALATQNYVEPLQRFEFLRYLRNPVFVTVVATSSRCSSIDGGLCPVGRFRGKNAACRRDRQYLMI